jgi:hypothetical protein
MGVDSASVPQNLLMIDLSEFLQRDLTLEVDLGRKFDLVLCLETGEHLPASAAPTLVKSLTHHADLILFSAAVPGQGGTNHINERPMSYWLDKFEACGYRAFDFLRPAIWNDPGIEWWYRQNLIVLARGALADQLPHTPPPIDAIHPNLLKLERDRSSEFARRVEKLAHEVDNLTNTLHTSSEMLETDFQTASRQVSHLLKFVRERQGPIGTRQW